MIICGTKVTCIWHFESCLVLLLYHANPLLNIMNCLSTFGPDSVLPFNLYEFTFAAERGVVTDEVIMLKLARS